MSNEKGNAIGVKKISAAESLFYRGFMLRNAVGILNNAKAEDLIIIGGTLEGMPAGVAIAYKVPVEAAAENQWLLVNFFVSNKARNKGIGHAMIELLKQELRVLGAATLKYQAVLKKETGDVFGEFSKRSDACRAEKVCRIYHYKAKDIIKSPFVRGSLAGNFSPSNDKLKMVSLKEFTELSEYMEELRENKGKWIPANLHPFIAGNMTNKECTIFAIDPELKKTAGWIVAVDVNNDTQLLYRTFFAREEYKHTQIAFYLFTEAVKRHFELYPDRDGMASIAYDNETAIRFSELFFRGTCDHISYEWVIEWEF